MFSRAELTVIATAIERAENRLAVQREVVLGISREWALTAAFIKSLEKHLAVLHENQRRLDEDKIVERFGD